MIGILVQLALSWIFLWLVYKKDLRVLGFVPTGRRLGDFIIFFSVTGLLCASGFGLRMLLADQHWQLNPEATGRLVVDGVWWNFKSVMFEELIFRGALFYFLIQKLGAKRAIWIGAAAFGVYHWFSHGTFGNPVAMVWDFTITGAMGLVLGYGFARTGSLYLPVAIHLGWNYVQQSIFSSGPIGNQLFIPVEPQPQNNLTVAVWLFVTFFPVISVLALNAWLIRWRTQGRNP